MSVQIKQQPARYNPVSAPDYLPKPLLQDLQLQRFVSIVARAYQHVPLFHQRMKEIGMAPEDLQSLEDIRKLPFSYKTDLRDTYPFGMFASPIREIVRLHASSGTTGKPVWSPTQEDLDVWTAVMSTHLRLCRVERHHSERHGYGLFTGGLGAHYGAEALGATVIPISGGNTERQIMVMKDFGVTAVCCTPSYFLHLLEQAQEMGVDIRELPLRAGVFGAEPWTQAMRERIETESGIKAFDIYGLSEIIGPGVGMECWNRRDCISLKIIFILKSSILKPVKCCRKGRWVNWCSRH